jgi:hypothetical protein
MPPPPAEWGSSSGGSSAGPAPTARAGIVGAEPAVFGPPELNSSGEGAGAGFGQPPAQQQPRWGLGEGGEGGGREVDDGPPDLI